MSTQAAQFLAMDPRWMQELQRQMVDYYWTNRKLLFGHPRQPGKSWMSQPFIWNIQEPNVEYPNHRGTYDEHMAARSAIGKFQHAMRRQDPNYWTNKSRVDSYLREHQSFSGKPYTAWLKVIEDAWAAVLRASSPVYQSYFGTTHWAPSKLHADGDVVIDESTSLKGKTMKTPKPPKKTYNTCAVRFMRGDNLAKCYTYRVPKKVKLHLGEEIVVPSWDRNTGLVSNGIAVVVELHPTPADNDVTVEYRFITGRVQKVK